MTAGRSSVGGELTAGADRAVSIGDRVSVRWPGAGAAESYRLLDPRYAEAQEAVISPASPLGLALVGQRVGSYVTYVANGTPLCVVVDDVIDMREIGRSSAG